jgi:hypothetical protein
MRLVAACGGGGGSGAATSTLTAPFSYGSTNYQYTVGVTAQTLEPSNPSSIKAWSISPALPAGLTFSTTAGNISGTPTVSSPSTQYVITGTTAAGEQSSVNLTIGVTSNILLNLGDTQSISFIQFDSSRVLSQDGTGYWVLWNYATTERLASGISLMNIPEELGTQPAPVALAGPAVVLSTASGLELRSSATGEVVAEIPAHLAWWKLASDGSYFCGGNGTGLTCWSPSGQQLLFEAGNYQDALVFAAPSELLVAMGAKGWNLIETVSSATWMSNVGPPFQGKFYAWFVDGSAFLTTTAVSNTVFVYSLASTLEDMRSLPSLLGLTGQGSWFWTFPLTGVISHTVTIYAVGDSALPTATFAMSSPTPTGTYITSLAGGSSTNSSGGGPGALSVIDLSGATPVATSYDVPPFVGLRTYAFNSPSQYMVGTSLGLLIDESTPGAPRSLDYGAVANLVGSMARAVFTTASGNTFSYNTTTEGFEPLTIELGADIQLSLSADGSVLAALGASGDVNIYSMPSGTVINSFPANSNLVSIGLSGPGTALGELLYSSAYGAFTAQAIPVTGGTPTVYPNAGAMLLFSPDGTQVALSDQPFPPSLGTDYGGSPTTSIYKNGTLVTTVSGWVLAWLNNSSFIVANYSCCTGGPGGGAAIFDGYQIYSSTGTPLPTPAAGPTTWASADPSSNSVVAGSLAVLVSGNLVIAQPF